MSEVAYVSEVRVEREPDGLRQAHLPGESRPVAYGMHGAIAAHYGREPGTFTDHASTIDHLVGAAVG